MECKLHPACHSMSTNVYLVCACAPGIAFGLLSSSHDFPTTLQHGTDLAEYHFAINLSLKIDDATSVRQHPFHHRDISPKACRHSCDFGRPKARARGFLTAAEPFSMAFPAAAGAALGAAAAGAAAATGAALGGPIAAAGLGATGGLGAAAAEGPGTPAGSALRGTGWGRLLALTTPAARSNARHRFCASTLRSSNIILLRWPEFSG